MKVTVVGLGLIGGSVALEVKHSGFAARVIGVDLSLAHQKQAIDLGLVDQVLPFEEAVSTADLIVLAVPVNVIAQILPHALLLMRDQDVVTDMGSTKEWICSQVKSHPRRPSYLASHPMAGTEFSGPKAAHLGLFKSKAAVICEKERSSATTLKRIEDLYDCLKMRRIYMSASEHDLHAAYVSHLSHISSFVLANTVLSKEQNVSAIFDLASGGFESTVRLAKSSPQMWAPIFEQNQEKVIEALEAYIQSLKEFHQTLVKKEFSQTTTLMERANEIRKVLERIEKKIEKN